MEKPAAKVKARSSAACAFLLARDLLAFLKAMREQLRKGAGEPCFSSPLRAQERAYRLPARPPCHFVTAALRG